MTLGERKKQLIEALQALYSLGESRAIAALVTEKISGLPFNQIETRNIVPLTGEQAQQFSVFEIELMKGKPVQYVLGEAWFLNRRFLVNEHVLIPRPETEELVTITLEHIKNQATNNHSFSILDIGTGSGCIAISMAAALPHASVSGIDVSKEALEIARQNAVIAGVQVHWINLNLLDACSMERLGMFDVILSNPPYIPISEKEMLDSNVADWEPGTALFTPDEDPLIFYKAISNFCLKHLKPGGLVALEGHRNFIRNVLPLFSGKGFVDASVKKDIYENERMVFATRS